MEASEASVPNSRHSLAASLPAHSSLGQLISSGMRGDRVRCASRKVSAVKNMNRGGGRGVFYCTI